MLKKLWHWTHDYLYALHTQSNAFIYRKPPEHYLGYIVENKRPVILIPGVYEKWHFLKALADPLSLKGHPIYALEHLGYNTKEVHHSAKLVRELIEEKDLYNVIILAHSKGGLIGKHLLAFDNKDGRVKKMIAIAAPFGGSHIVRFITHKSFREFRPEHETIKKLQEQKGVNHKIISIFGIFDNHVWPTSSSVIEGGKNIQINCHGHHKILFDKHVRDIVLREIEKG
ncbi:MAG: alpha/beta fold hydrolase [Candidatus Sungiibacteriota bacterium]